MVRDSDFDGAPSWERSVGKAEDRREPRRFSKRPSGPGESSRGDRKRSDGEGRDRGNEPRRFSKRLSGPGESSRESIEMEKVAIVVMSPAVSQAPIWSRRSVAG